MTDEELVEAIARRFDAIIMSGAYADPAEALARECIRIAEWARHSPYKLKELEEYDDHGRPLRMWVETDYPPLTLPPDDWKP